MSDCMNGVVPPQLPPKESAVVLDLLREVRLIPIAYDFEEERQFLKGIFIFLYHYLYMCQMTPFKEF